MKQRSSLRVMFLAMLAAYLMLPAQLYAAFVSGSTGADGDFNPTANTVLQIPDSGVFNFGVISIPAGVTVTFKKNAKNTPVTILATGDVTVNGTISAAGGNGSFIIPGAGGPGGFIGGIGGVVNANGKRGEGPGGGTGGNANNNNFGSSGGGGGGFGGNGGNSSTWQVYGVDGGTAYGNERILPIIGGSGGGGGGGTNSYNGGSGGGGGGGLVIASSGTITVNGSINANGGNGANGESSGWGAAGGGGGSGGSIRLITNTIAGNGSITANGGSRGDGPYGGNYTAGNGGAGRIRFETVNITRTSGTSPPMSFGYPYAVVPANMPTLTITSIGGLQVPSVPNGAFQAPDVMLPLNTKNPVTVVVTAANIPAGTTVSLKSTPQTGTVNSASGTLVGTDTASSVSINLNISTAYPSIITASVTFQLTASNGGPIYAGGERVEKVRVATNLGGGSSITYITGSGKEIPAVM